MRVGNNGSSIIWLQFFKDYLEVDFVTMWTQQGGWFLVWLIVMGNTEYALLGRPSFIMYDVRGIEDCVLIPLLLHYKFLGRSNKWFV